MIFKYFIPEFLDISKTVFIDHSICEVKDRLKITLIDLKRYLKNPYCFLEGDKYYGHGIYGNNIPDMKHAFFVPHASMRRRYPIIFVVPEKRVTQIIDYVPYDDIIPISLVKDKKINYFKIGYNLPEGFYRKYEKFIDDNRELLLELAYNKKINNSYIEELENIIKF